jgi:hypothetical protein
VVLQVSGWDALIPVFQRNDSPKAGLQLTILLRYTMSDLLLVLDLFFVDLFNQLLLFQRVWSSVVVKSPV